MAKRSLDYNLNQLVELQKSILQILDERGDVQIPEGACLGDVPYLINGLSNKSYTSNGVQTEIAKCGPLITRFAVFSDVHCGSPYTYPDTYKDNQGYINGTAAIRTYAKEAMDGNLDFIVFTGDTLGPEGGTSDVYSALHLITDEWRSILAPTGIPLYMIPGNHDSGCEIQYWHSVSAINVYDNDSDMHFMNSDRTCFWKEINGDLYIWFALWNNKMFVYSDAQFEWLFNLLDSNRDRTRIFLFSHWYDGTVDGFGWRYLNGTYINHGWHADDDPRFGRIKSYKNLIWFSGHAHTNWRYEDTYPTIKVHSHDTARMVNVPSMKDNNQDVRVSVYSNMVVVEAYSSNVRYSKIYFIGNGETSEVIRVNYFLTGVNSSNQKTIISEGDSFETTLTLQPYYENMVVTVYMDGVDVTASSYDSATGVVSIASVTGTIDLTAAASSTAQTYSITYNLNGYHTSSPTEIVEDMPYNIVLTPDSGFDANPTSINVSIDGIGQVITNGYEDSEYIEITSSPDGTSGTVITTITFTSEMALGDVTVSARASKNCLISYDLSEDTIIDNHAAYVEYGDSYLAHVSMQDGTEPDVQILINGLDYSAEYYDDGVISIPAVTTDVTIKVQNYDSRYADCVKMIYDVTDISTPTQLLYSSYNVGKYITYMVFDDSGVQESGQTSYQFDKVGKQTVYVKLADNAFHSNFANGCSDLQSVKIPSNITTYSASMFRNCPKLHDITINCTSSSIQLSTYNLYEDAALQKVVFGPGIYGIAQSNFDPTMTAFNEVYIYNPSSFNWNAGALTNTGTIHAVEGADISSVITKLPNFTVVRDLS